MWEEVRRAMEDVSDGAGDWIDQARLTLLVAEDLLAGGLCEEAVANSFLAMVYAARAALEVTGGVAQAWEDTVHRFQAEAMPGLGLSKENQRSLVIVADLYRRVVDTREMEADPLTARACLEDARSFVTEVAEGLAAV